MSRKIIIPILLISILLLGFYGGLTFRQMRLSIIHNLELKFKMEKKEGLTEYEVYNYYRDRNGQEVRHGDYYWGTTGGGPSIHQKYEHGEVVGGSGKYN